MTTPETQPPRVGVGASLAYTAALRGSLPDLLRRLRVRRLLDAGSGPFSWLAETDLAGIDYTGAEHNGRVVAWNTTKHGRPGRQFLRLDILRDPLPHADLVLCREVLNRLCFAAIHAFLTNFLTSEALWLLACSHPGAVNAELNETRPWRQLDLSRPPFNLQPPREALPDWAGNHPPRYLCLWHREQVETALAATPRSFIEYPSTPGTESTAVPTTSAHRVVDPGRALVTDNVLADGGLEFVTVVYPPEVLMLRLQARSIARFVPPTALRRAHVILNDDDPATLRRTIEGFAADEYAWAADRLVFWTAEELHPGIQARGWRKQQSLKLSIATRIESGRYLVLDAKNHFVRPSGPEGFYDPLGRLRSFRARRGGLLQAFLRNSLSYFGLPPELAETRVMPATTPYGLYTSVVRSLLAEIEAREGIAFARFFHSPGRDMTEFFLYFAFLMARGIDIDRLYVFGGRYAATLFGKHPESVEGEHQVLAALNNPNVRVFGLHRARVAKLHPSSRDRVLSLWLDAGLFPDRETAEAFFADLLRTTT